MPVGDPIRRYEDSESDKPERNCPGGDAPLFAEEGAPVAAILLSDFDNRLLRDSDVAHHWTLSPHRSQTEEVQTHQTAQLGVSPSSETRHQDVRYDALVSPIDISLMIDE